MKLSRESVIIFCVGAADLATTLLWTHTHGAEEGNPLFAHYLAMGPFVFAVVKLVMLAAPIFLLEWARNHRPVFTMRAARFGIAAYLVLYGVGVIRLNGEHSASREDLQRVAMAELPYPLGTDLASR
jgi:hypothetical protein